MLLTQAARPGQRLHGSAPGGLHCHVSRLLLVVSTIIDIVFVADGTINIADRLAEGFDTPFDVIKSRFNVKRHHFTTVQATPVYIVSNHTWDL